MLPVATPRSTVDAPSRERVAVSVGDVGSALSRDASGRSERRSFSLAAASLMLRDFWSTSSLTVARSSAWISRSLAFEPVLAIQLSSAMRRSSAV
jgi:hypothetical protein